MTIDEAKEIIDNRKNRDTWLRAFQKFCNSDEIREESGKNGINACGYGIQCDMCLDSSNRLACALSMDDYCFTQKKQIDYSNVSAEYFRKLLEGEV